MFKSTFLFCILFISIAQGQPEPKDPFAKWEKEISAIEKRLKANPPKAGGTLFVGSSSIRLWDLEKSFPKQEYINAGFGGSEIRDSTYFAKQIIFPYQPSRIVLYAGDNDVAKGRKPKDVLADFQAFCQAVHQELPKTKIHFIAIKPSLKRWEQYETQMEANALVQKECMKDQRWNYVDIVKPMLGDDGKPMKKLFKDDLLHLNDEGYAIWNGIIDKALAE